MSDGLAPRLLDVRAAAAYLGGISPWTVRAYVANGELHPVRLPAVRAKRGQGRRLLFDRRELDAWIDRRKQEGV